jgi:CheY-like chemotaxis protein
MKFKTLIATRSRWNARAAFAPLGEAGLFRHPGTCRELRGAARSDPAAARQCGSLFQGAATLPGASLPLAAEPSQAATAPHNRILIADDDSLVRGSLAAVLEFEGYMVVEAPDGVKAVSRAIEQMPDLVLLDLNMPHWDGWTAFSQLDRVAPLVPVIVITARPNQYAKAAGLGVDAFMEKPLDIPILVAAIKRLTSEDEARHLRRITSTAFVTELLGSTAVGR